MFRSFIFVGCCVFTTIVIFVPVTPAFSQLANSPWPELYHDAKLSKVTDTQGPSTNVAQRWRRLLDATCVTSPSLGSDSFLYLTNNRYLLKKHYDTGLTIVSKQLGFESWSQPLVASESGQDRIYTGERGELRKFRPDLTEFTTGGWPVTLRYNLVQVFPIGFVLSPTNNTTIIFVAIDNQETQTRIVLYAVDKGTGTINDTFDIKAWAEGPPLNILSPDVDNTVSIGPDLIPGHSGKELCYVLLRQGHLLAVEFNPSTKVFTNVEWYSCSGSAPNCDPYTPDHSETSPVVSSDGSRVYFATGIDADHSSSLLSVRTTDGRIVAQSFEIGGYAIASPLIDNDTARGGNVIYIHSTNGPEYAFLDQGTSFSCVWRTPKDWQMTGGNAGKSSGSTGLLYIPFTKGGTGSQAYGGAFDTSPTAPCIDPNPFLQCTCTSSGAQWFLPFQDQAERDPCTRSLGFNPTTGKSQIFFGTGQAIYAFE